MPDASADCAFLPQLSQSLNDTQTFSAVFIISVPHSTRVRVQLPSSLSHFSFFLSSRVAQDFSSLRYSSCFHYSLRSVQGLFVFTVVDHPSYSRQDSNPHCTDPKSVVSCRWTTGAKSSQRESNPQLLVRSQMFYPLNYTMLNKTVSSFLSVPVGGLLNQNHDKF